MNPFHTADPKDVLNGRVTDVYFERTRKILAAKKVNPRVKAEFIAKSLPEGWPWAVLAGIEECFGLFRTMKVRVRAMEEGAVFRPYEPVMEIEGPYAEFGIFETALLGLICQASGIATRAARFKTLAGERLLLSFGTRRMHPILAPMIERYAYMGGCDGVSVVKSGEMLGQDPVGTMPHALILLLGDTVKALEAFHEVMDRRVRRVALVDTFNDEKFEALRVAEALGRNLYGIRLDTPTSRRGNFRKILEEVRWELDLRGYRHVKIFVSGGITEAMVADLNSVVDGYGVGTAISNAPVVDFAMDIVEIDGKPIAKRGKLSGSKSVLRCDRCGARAVVPLGSDAGACACGGRWIELLKRFCASGKRSRRSLSAGAVRKKVLNEIETRGLTV